MNKAHKAIFKTLIYYDIFDWVLTADEVFRFLIEDNISRDDVNQMLNELVGKNEVILEAGLFALAGKEKNIQKRKDAEIISLKKYLRARRVASFIRLIPWVDMVGITGGLAMGDAEENDDIDIIIITKTNRLYLSRLFEFALLSISGLRRHPKAKNSANKICPNLYIDYEGMRIQENLCAAHDLVRLMPLYERNGVYQTLLTKNSWYKNYFPNWEPIFVSKPAKKNARQTWLGNGLERFVRRFQLWYLKPKRTIEKVSAHALYFHPNDMYPKILTEFNKRIESLDKEK